MTAITLEAFLARIYVDDAARSKFLADPYGEALKAGLTAEETEEVASVDRLGLELFSQSLEHKRNKRRTFEQRRHLKR